MSSRVLLIIAAAALCGCPGSTRPAAEKPSDGTQLVEVGVRRMQIDCRGTGSPTVVIDTDHGRSSAAANDLAAQLGNGHRVCTYDRAGLGESDPDPAGPRSLQIVAYDLRHALAAAGEKGPVVIIGRGLTAYMARQLAADAPELVAGVVLVDPIHLGMEPELRALLKEDDLAEWDRRARAAEPIDYERSRELLAAADLGEVDVAIVGSGSLGRGVEPAPEHDDAVDGVITAILDRLVERTGATRQPDVATAVATVSR